MFGPSANVLFVLLLLEWLFGKLSAEPFVTGSVCTIVAYLLVCTVASTYLLLQKLCLISEER
jgi:hypothetical protein